MAPERPVTLGLGRHEPGSPCAQLFKSVATAIDDADPIGLLQSGAPGDEYSTEIATIVPRVARSRAADEVVDILHEEFSRMFGQPTAGPREAYVSPAAAIWQAVIEYREGGTGALLVIDVSTASDPWSLHGASVTRPRSVRPA